MHVSSKKDDGNDNRQDNLPYCWNLTYGVIAGSGPSSSNAVMLPLADRPLSGEGKVCRTPRSGALLPPAGNRCEGEEGQWDCAWRQVARIEKKDPPCGSCRTRSPRSGVTASCSGPPYSHECQRRLVSTFGNNIWFVLVHVKLERNAQSRRSLHCGT